MLKLKSNSMSRTVCIYHLVDLDGQMSAAIVKLWFNQQEVPNKKGEPINTIDFIGYNYGNPIPDLSEYDKVIMCDISFPKQQMEMLFERLDIQLVWIDHHISAFKDVIGEEFLKDKIDLSTKYNGLRDLRFAACELTWKYFFPNEPMPEIVRLLGRYGCLVVFTERKFFSISNIAHESSHVVDFLFEHIGEKNIGDEAKAYLMGWAVDCMNQVRTNKFK